MNKFITCTRILVLVFILLSATYTSAAVHNERYSSKMTKIELQQRLDNIPSSVSLRYTPEVHEIVDSYIRRYRVGSERILGRTNVFFPIFEHELSKNGHLPDEVKHLAIIESSLQVQAVSRTGAVGLWQFMKETAKLQGLSVNESVDERKDPYLSTKAAYKYLTRLHKEFGDWTLALAAYNCGPGNVRKAIRRSQSTDFWTLESYLPKETRRYIPKFVAATYLMEYYHAHELTPNVEVPKFERTAIARIHNYTSFREIREITGVNISEIKELNPAFKGYNIPSSKKGYLLTLPEDAMFQFLINKNMIENLEFTLTNPKESFEKTIVVSGFQMRKREIEIFGNTPEIDMLAKKPIRSSYTPQETVRSSIKEEQDFIYHRLEIGESLVDLVARMPNSSLEEIIALNDIDLNEPPRAGMLIKSKK